MEHNHNSTNKRILIITTYTKPINMGGGSNAEAFSEFLNREGYSAKVLTKTNTGLIRINKNIISVRWPNSLFLKIISLLWIFPYSLYLCLSSNYVFFISSHFPLMPILMIFCKIFRIKVVFQSTLIGDDDPFNLKNKDNWNSKISLFAIKHANIFHSINSAFTESYIKAFNTNQNVIETTQGVDTSTFTIRQKINKVSLCKALCIDPEIPIILSVGFLIDRKGFKEMFQILAEIKQDFTYLIVGDYMLTTNHPLYFLNNEMNSNYCYGSNLLKNKVRFLGPVADIKKIYAISDMLFMNSCSEGTPNVLLEAMASGVVPIVRELPGYKDFLIKDNGTGLLFNNNTEAKNLIEALLLNSNKINKLSQEAAKFAESYFSFNETWARLNEKI